MRLARCAIGAVDDGDAGCPLVASAEADEFAGAQTSRAQPRCGYGGVKPRRGRASRRGWGLFGGFVCPADQTEAAAEPARQEQRAETLTFGAQAFGASDRVGHARPVPAQVLQGTHLDCFFESPFWSIHSPPAPIQVPQIGFCLGSSFATFRRYAANSGPSARPSELRGR